ncbi:hypothetical protein EYF80_027557 [Liparis tanakae]|uniref:Uncharacterized protein n=1 Tax=Liparis tanakae TaxID=230148 RepID=A0A4Z2H8D8_9TELE|nr:hypothetical protein EYF80_027557 [Liparis tanakae]
MKQYARFPGTEVELEGGGHLRQVPLVDEENQTPGGEQQEEPEGAGQPPPPSTQGVRYHLPQHDAAQSDAALLCSAAESKEERWSEQISGMATDLGVQLCPVPVGDEPPRESRTCETACVPL